uniref:C2H2-type domain-containing protein n=1 Tax=Panagrolaimus superbus TaxID=310955 RepID=A0A914Y6B9_9BILA
MGCATYPIAGLYRLAALDCRCGTECGCAADAGHSKPAYPCALAGPVPAGNCTDGWSLRAVVQCHQATGRRHCCPLHAAGACDRFYSGRADQGHLAHHTATGGSGTGHGWTGLEPANTGRRTLHAGSICPQALNAPPKEEAS